MVTASAAARGPSAGGNGAGDDDGDARRASDR